MVLIVDKKEFIKNIIKVVIKSIISTFLVVEILERFAGIIINTYSQLLIIVIFTLAIFWFSFIDWLDNKINEHDAIKEDIIKIKKKLKMR
ncbi:MAG: hypothetical protein KJ906_04410 [Nanoarchaeota archaeon]|nr:hypothetical protein [Nanoarchaeota archaeon]